MPRTLARDFKTSLTLPSNSPFGFLDVGNPPAIQGLTSATFAMWVRVADLTGNRCLMGQWQSVTGGRHFNLLMRSTSKRLDFIVSTDGNTQSIVTGNYVFNTNTWYHIVCSIDPGVARKIYVNGVLDVNNASSPAPYTSSTPNFYIGKSADGNNVLGQFDEVQVWNRALTDDEVSSLYTSGTVPKNGLVLNYNLNEGAGSTARDQSVNALDAALTNATYGLDTPTRERKLINSNMIRNGDFEFYPSSNGASTTSGWIDGTGGVSTTNNSFGWYASSNGSGYSAQFDNTVFHSGSGSIRLSTANTTPARGFVRITKGSFDFVNLVPVLPNTEYVLTYWIKTNNVIGANAQWNRYDGLGNAIGSNFSSTGVSGTQNWQQITMNVTTGPTDRFMELNLNNNNAGAISDAWFDDIVLTPKIANNRTRIRNSLSALKFNGAGYVNAGNNAAFNLTNNFTMACWVKVSKFGTFQRFMSKSSGSGYALGIDSNGKLAFTTFNVKDYFGGTPSQINPNQWYLLGVTMTSSNNAVFYINGRKSETVTGTTPANVATSPFFIGSRDTTTDLSFATIDTCYMWNSALTDQQMADLYENATVPSSGLILHYNLNEGAGSTVNDSSTIGNTGTITGAVFTDDVFMRSRRAISENFVKNGDFERVPPFTAATTTNDRWIDGTSGGSTTNDLFGWKTYLEYAAAIQFDNSAPANGLSSLKIASAASPPSAVHQISAYIAANSGSLANLRSYALNLIPGVNYTVKFNMKTASVSNGNGRGARVNLTVYDTSGGSAAGASSSYVNGTTGWTAYSFTFTAPKPFGILQCQIVGETGTAWFDDVSVLPTTSSSRALVT